MTTITMTSHSYIISKNSQRGISLCSKVIIVPLLTVNTVTEIISDKITWYMTQKSCTLMIIRQKLCSKNITLKRDWCSVPLNISLNFF